MLGDHRDARVADESAGLDRLELDHQGSVVQDSRRFGRHEQEHSFAFGCDGRSIETRKAKDRRICQREHGFDVAPSAAVVVRSQQNDAVRSFQHEPGQAQIQHPVE